jgi:hypothetical protein
MATQIGIWRRIVTPVMPKASERSRWARNSPCYTAPAVAARPRRSP